MNWLSREHTIASADFNRWLVPPAALAVHLSIGMAYGFSVFWLPLSKALGVDAPRTCLTELSLLDWLFTRECDWKISHLGWMYTLFFVFLGSSAAVFGHWLERAGPRKAGVIAACCWGGGFFISALGIAWHQLWLLWLGSGVIGGCGLGLGYISPVSTLIKWFPDRRGLATGMAIMGFGGGALIGAPLADLLMKYFANEYSVGVLQTFLVLGTLYFSTMMAGALGYRVPPEGWKPAGWSAPTQAPRRGISQHHVHLDDAHKTPQFWLLWCVLCMNVSAGIGVLGMASPLLQEIFGGRLMGVDQPFSLLDTSQKQAVASIGAGFAGLLSLFNIAGRLGWASLSDALGRKMTFTVFFLSGIMLYASVPAIEKSGSVALFVMTFCVIVSLYGGGFATIPAYLADRFGTAYVGAIHGRLLTAWSAAGILGPVLVNYLREYQLGQGTAPAEAYHFTMYVLAGLLTAGLLCNLAVKPVAERFFMPEPADHSPLLTPEENEQAEETEAEARAEGA